ncbi:MAG TPA: formate dehydrogenase accessory sulfurtransferase FdhD [Puia sp.]|nr:formate dehydrogenase accessory sulfurtransferase FdhD [Puia sp.]
MSIASLPVWKVISGHLVGTTDKVAVEQPLEIRLQYGPDTARTEKNLSVTMRTPGHDTELALGFLFTEGILPDASVILGIQPGPDSVLISLHNSFLPDLGGMERHSFTNSSCGVCGKSSIDALRRQPSPVPVKTGQAPVATELLFALPQRLRESQEIFDSTGGLHAAALFDRNGRLAALREDIGRHNALDKLIGYTFLQDTLPVSDHILLLSGRACFELVQKAGMAGIAIVAAVGPPSSLAVQAAEDAGMTLVGFLRDKRCNIYTGAHRIRL